ncbi:MAG: sulfatase-like hydrolase/transferase [Pirellulales bacterium]
MIKVLAVVVLSSIGVATAHAQRPEKPNVLLLLTDDLGWQDVKCYDIDEPSPMETPNIDIFAKQGVTFWQGYSPAPTCAPSRCAILSGNHPARSQKTHVVGGAPPKPHNKHSRMMDPWYSGRMPADEMTLAKALRRNGYTTGHSGKWHIAISHNAFPQPQDLGFDFTRASRGSRSSMKNRLAGFATTAEGDPFRLDENGYPFHQTNEDALTFLKENKDKPFFLYYATWLVHAPIHTRSEAHLNKYVKRLGTDPTNTPTKETPGQLNPYYCAMVQELDYYVGIIFEYLNETDDPRWPGHKLRENTYVIFTSDNGGMEGGPTERYTDNKPLARGKISAMEGGTRVPLLIAGPGIAPGVHTDVMANGLDFYPTILSMTGTPKPPQKNLDGCDLLPLLHNNPTDADLVKHADGTTRDMMVWHFPHGSGMESTIRVGDYKLVRNFDHISNEGTAPLELFQLYDSSSGESRRVDIEESQNLTESKPELAQSMNAQLTAALTEMHASYPYYNPACATPLPNQDKVCTVEFHQRQGQQVRVTYREYAARVTGADLIYTLNGGEQYEEWFRMPATLAANNTVTAELPAGTTHYYLNLIDENQFLRSYPEVAGKGVSFADTAISTQQESAAAPMKHPKTRANGKVDRNIPFDRWDTNKDEHLSLEEYMSGLAGKSDLEERFNRFDTNDDGKVSREEFVRKER